MDFYIVNESKDPRCDEASVNAWANAVDLQILNDFGPAWGIFGNVFVAEKEDDIPDGAGIVRLVDDEAEGELGDHDEQFGKVEARIIIPQIPGDEISGVISHEILEASLDPYANCWVQFDWTGGGKLTAREACDAVEDGSYVVHLESVGRDVTVSNFVLPRWFDAESTAPGGYDFLGKLSAPFSRTEGGYLILMTGGIMSTEFGESVAQWRKDRRRKRAAKRVRAASGLVAKPEK